MRFVGCERIMGDGSRRADEKDWRGSGGVRKMVRWGEKGVNAPWDGQCVRPERNHFKFNWVLNLNFSVVSLMAIAGIYLGFNFGVAKFANSNFRYLNLKEESHLTFECNFLWHLTRGHVAHLSSGFKFSKLVLFQTVLFLEHLVVLLLVERLV